MLLILVNTILAIEQAKYASQWYSGNLRFGTDWPGLFGFLVFLALLLFSIAALGYGILYALRQSGAQRFTNVRTWAERK
jgi:hypothetical protein